MDVGADGPSAPEALFTGFFSTELRGHENQPTPTGLRQNNMPPGFKYNRYPLTALGFVQDLFMF